MKKILLTIFFSILVFLFFPLSAKSAFATIYFSSTFDNTAGRVDVTVSYYIKDRDFNTVYNSGPIRVPAGAFVNDQPNIPNIPNDPYTLTWSTECTDPTVNTIFQAEFPGYYLYTFGRMYVQCPLPDNLTASCVSGHFNLNWRAGPSATDYAIRFANPSGLEAAYDYIGNVTSYNYTPQQAGVNYSWWLHGIKGTDWSYATSGPNVSCPITNNPPIGNHDTTNNSTCSTTGWAADKDAPSTSIAVDIYRDGPPGVGTAINRYATNVPRSDVNTYLSSPPLSWSGVSGNHGFSVTFDSSSGLFDGKPHNLYAYAIDSAGGTNPLLGGSPKTITCAAPTPVPSCNNYAWQSTNVSSTNVIQGSTFNISCNYGAVPDCINAYSGATAGTGQCTYTGANGTTANFSCKADNVGTNLYTLCKTIAGTAGNCCPQTNNGPLVNVITPTPTPLPKNGVQVIIDNNSNGKLDAGESFGTPNVNFSSTIASVNQNSTRGTFSATSSIGSNGIGGPWEATYSNIQYQIIPKVGWQLTKYSSNKNLSGSPSCAANTSCDYSSGWTRTYSPASGETVWYYLGIKPVPTSTPTPTPAAIPTSTPTPTPTPTGAPTYTISGHVFIDNGAGTGTANNGVKDGSEPDYNLGSVTLTRDGTGSPLTTSTSTGAYSFSGLTGSSTYHITQSTMPAGYILSNGGQNPNFNPRTVSITTANVFNVNFGIISTSTPTNTPTPTPGGTPCTVTTSPVSLNLTVGGATGAVSASVTSGLGTATINQMRFGSYNTSIATVSPTSDLSSPYSTAVTAVTAGATAVWATADLSDGRTCQSSSTTDTDTNVTILTPTPTPTGAPGYNLYVSNLVTKRGTDCASGVATSSFVRGDNMVICFTEGNSGTSATPTNFVTTIFKNRPTQPAYGTIGDAATQIQGPYAGGFFVTNTTLYSFQADSLVCTSCTGSVFIDSSNTNSGETNETDNFRTVPYTVTPAYAIYGNVFIDSNNNGVKDGSEVNYTSTTPVIQAVGASGTINPTTNSGGAYSFSGLAPNYNYDVQLAVPTGYVLSNNGQNPNFNPRTVPLTAADVFNINFGIIPSTPTACPPGQINPHTSCGGGVCFANTAGCGANTCGTNADCTNPTPTPVPGAINLIVTSVKTDKSTYAPNEPMIITSTIRNVGAVSAGSFSVGYTPNGPTSIPAGCPVYITFGIGSLAAGAFYTNTNTSNAPSAANTYQAGAYADDNPCNQVVESTKTDNYNFSAPYTVALPSTYQLSGHIYVDDGAGGGIANNGVKDGGEADYNLGSVTLTRDGTGSPLTTTTGTGAYSFSSLSGNYNYNITLTLPQNYALSNTGSNPNTNPRSVPVTTADVTNINFGITKLPTYTIGGKCVIDYPPIGTYDAADVNLTTCSITYSSKDGTVTGTSPSSGGGGFTPVEVPPGEYGITYGGVVPPGYIPSYPPGKPPTHDVIVGPGCDVSASSDFGASCVPAPTTTPPAGSITGLTFGFKPPDEWIQSSGTDIRNDNGTSGMGTIIPSSASPSQCAAPFGNLYTSVNGAGGSPGIIFSGNIPADFGTGGGSASIPNWKVGTPSDSDFYTAVNGSYATSYAYVLGRIKQSGITPTNLCSGSLSNCAISSSLASTAYIIDAGGGNTTITSATIGSGKKYIILVNGNLIIKSNIIVPKTSALTFIVLGDIHIDKTVGAPEPNSWQSAATQVEGFYSANHSFYIDGNQNSCVTSDLRLNMAGSIIVNAGGTDGQFINNRTLCTNNTYCPVFTITERPDFVLNAPESIKQIKTIYQEIAP